MSYRHHASYAVEGGEDAPVTMILVNNFFEVLKERVPN